MVFKIMFACFEKCIGMDKLGQGILRKKLFPEAIILLSTFMVR